MAPLFNYDDCCWFGVLIWVVFKNKLCHGRMLPEGFPFHQFNITYYSWCLVPVWRL